jgi:hypothetical protein
MHAAHLDSTAPYFFIFIFLCLEFSSLEQVHLYGAHVTSWKNEHGEELLFLSSKVPQCVMIVCAKAA